jgi:hypothetical protein
MECTICCETWFRPKEKEFSIITSESLDIFSQSNNNNEFNSNSETNIIINLESSPLSHIISSNSSNNNDISKRLVEKKEISSLDIWNLQPVTLKCK